MSDQTDQTRALIEQWREYAASAEAIQKDAHISGDATTEAAFRVKAEAYRKCADQLAAVLPLSEWKCDCGAALTMCCDCAVADWQAAHPECPTCCPFDNRPLSERRSHEDQLRYALAESLKMQSHYAALLNMHDGGKRIGFDTVEAWLARLAVAAPSADLGPRRHDWQPHQVGPTHPHADATGTILQCERCMTIQGEPGSETCPL